MNNGNIIISVVTPVYGCYKRLNKILLTITDSFEIIMINDSSPDNAWEDIKELAKKDNRAK